jgi:hypothetical protein
MLTLSHPTVVQDLRVLEDLIETEHRPFSDRSRRTRKTLQASKYCRGSA